MPDGPAIEAIVNNFIACSLKIPFEYAKRGLSFSPYPKFIIT